MWHGLHNICYITSNSWLYNKGGSCYVAKFLLCNKKLCYIAHSNLPDVKFSKVFAMGSLLMYECRYVLTYMRNIVKSDINSVGTKVSKISRQPFLLWNPELLG